MTKVLLFLCLFLTSFSLSAQKTWTGAMDATWANAGNWMPAGVPSSTDEVLFNNAMSNTVSLAAATSVGQIKVSNNSTLILKSSVTASLDLTITGATGDDLVVDAGSSLNITSASNVVAEQIIQIIIPTTVTASISGNMAFSNTGTAKIDHRLLTTDVGSAVFQSGSVFTADLGFNGSPFGSINPASVTFADGSRYISKDGGSPFGALITTPAVVVFNFGSTYQHDRTTAPQLNERIYPNFEYTKIVNSQNLTAVRINGNLIIKSSGGATLNPTAGTGDSFSLGFYSFSNLNKVTGDLIVENGGIFTLGSTAVAGLIVSGNVLVKNGGILRIGTGAGKTVIVFSGNLTVDNGGSLTAGTGTGAADFYFRTGDDDQIITNNSGTNFGNISKMYVTGHVKLASNLEVQDLDLYSMAGSDISLENYDLKVTGNISSADPFARYVIARGTGKLKRPNVGVDPVLFPVFGGFVTLSNSGTPDEFSVNQGLYEIINPTYNSLNVWNGIWNISESIAGGSNVTMTLNPKDLDQVSMFVPAIVVLGHGNPNGTFNALPATYVSDAFGGTLTANNVTTFSPFIIANDVALGVTLTNFTAHLTNKNTALLNWQTENEKDNSGFEIQRSTDAKDWSNIGFVKGKGQSSVAFDYTFEDKGPLSILTYYRLKQADFDGKESYSKVVNIYPNKKNKAFSVYPNPTTSNKINVELTSDRDDRIDFEVVDIVGKTVHTMSQNVTNGLNTIAFDNLAVTKGIYFIRAKQNGIVTAVVRFVRL
jgi:Secretion system C-terminal sorting domain